MQVNKFIFAPSTSNLSLMDFTILGNTEKMASLSRYKKLCVLCNQKHFEDSIQSLISISKTFSNILRYKWFTLGVCFFPLTFCVLLFLNIYFSLTKHLSLSLPLPLPDLSLSLSFSRSYRLSYVLTFAYVCMLFF